jgi:hypothetical protein
MSWGKPYAAIAAAGAVSSRTNLFRTCLSRAAPEHTLQCSRTPA